MRYESDLECAVLFGFGFGCFGGFVYSVVVVAVVVFVVVVFLFMRN